LFLGDSVSNVVRVIDRDSGAQLDQFFPCGHLGYNLGPMLSVPLQGADLLILPAAHGEPDQPAPYRGVVAWRIAPGEPLPDCRGTMGQAPDLLLDDDTLDRVMFVPRPQPRLFLLRNPRSGQAGRLWAVPVNLEGQSAAEVLSTATPVVDMPVPEWASRVAVDVDSEMIGLLSNNGSQASVSALIDDLQLGAPLDPQIAGQVDSLAVVRPVKDGNAVALALLSIPFSGQILALAFDPAGAAGAAVIQTGGTPQALAISPDRRRAYAVHAAAAQVTVLDLDCAPLPGCIQVGDTLRVGDLPSVVQFSPDGAEALVLHLYTGRISVIE
jgi:hypothetical protein